MKKNILFMFIGMFIMAGIVVAADNLSASEVDYRDTKVDQALDTLYQRSTYTEYDGSTEVTPSATQQTLSTNNKLLKNNITINAIPSTFKELTQTTTVTANNLISGITAYDNNGNLITGTMGTNCVVGTFNCTGNCHTSTGMTLTGLDFVPTIFMSIKNDYTAMTYFDTSKSDKFTVSYTGIDVASSRIDITRFFVLNNGVKLYNWSNEFEGQTTYIACR